MDVTPGSEPSNSGSSGFNNGARLDSKPFTPTPLPDPPASIPSGFTPTNGGTANVPEALVIPARELADPDAGAPVLRQAPSASETLGSGLSPSPGLPPLPRLTLDAAEENSEGQRVAPHRLRLSPGDRPALRLVGGSAGLSAGPARRRSDRAEFRPERGLWPHEVSPEALAGMANYALNFHCATIDFRAAAVETGAQVERFPLKVVNQAGEALTIDIAHYGARNPKRALLVLGGVHGVEGFMGSMVEIALMQSRPQLPSDMAVVFVHCLNPYGMAYLRRGDENNVDLNRNMLLRGDHYQGAPPGYEELRRLLSPQGALPVFSSVRFYAELARLFVPSLLSGPAERYRSLRSVLLQGQYEDPKGLFYGGEGIAESSRWFQDFVRERFQGCSRLVGIDLHAGMGKYGCDTIFLDWPSDPGRSKFITRHTSLPVQVINPQAGKLPRGTIAEAVPRLLPRTDVYWFMQEFGTFHSLGVLQAIAEENQVHHFGPSSRREQVKKALLQAASPDDPIWRQSVLRRASRLFAEAGKFLTEAVFEAIG